VTKRNLCAHAGESRRRPTFSAPTSTHLSFCSHRHNPLGCFSLSYEPNWLPKHPDYLLVAANGYFLLPGAPTRAAGSSICPASVCEHRPDPLHPTGSFPRPGCPCSGSKVIQLQIPTVFMSRREAQCRPGSSRSRGVPQ